MRVPKAIGRVEIRRTGQAVSVDHALARRRDQGAGGGRRTLKPPCGGRPTAEVVPYSVPVLTDIIQDRRATPQDRACGRKERKRNRPQLVTERPGGGGCSLSSNSARASRSSAVNLASSSARAVTRGAM